MREREPNPYRVSTTSEPEIIPPGGHPRRSSDTLSDENLENLARILDNLFRIPGTQIRFGLDALAGLIPGFGDMLTGISSMLIVMSAWQRGLPRVAIARMVANVAIDSLLGSMPIIGDLFDVAWKSNTKNVALLKSYEMRDRRRQSVADWGFLLLALLAIVLIIAIPITVLLWLIGNIQF